MGATASIQRPGLKYISKESALSQGYSTNTITFVTEQLEKKKDASDLKTRTERLNEVKLLRQQIRQLYRNGVKNKQIIRKKLNFLIKIK